MTTTESKFIYFPEITKEFNSTNLGVKIAGVRKNGTQFQFGLNSMMGVQWFPICQCTVSGEKWLRKVETLGGFDFPLD